MMKRLQDFWERLRGDKGRLRATVRVDFYPNRTAYPSLVWHNSVDQERDSVYLAVCLYARILFELAEMNETRVAKELMAFLAQVTNLVLTEEGAPNRPRLPLGELILPTDPPSETPSRSYAADFFQYQDGQFRVNFQGSLGKEGVYLPTTYVVFLQDCINRLSDQNLQHLAQSLRRLHEYYKLRQDFWDSASVSAGPAFALSPGEPSPEAKEAEEVKEETN
ncbi:MAG: hypothetical protein P8X65_01625 [Syntrophobacterales bacterium]|jgi:hypothetical protein